MTQRETTGHWEVNRKGEIVQTGMGGIVATCPSLTDAQNIVALHNESIKPRGPDPATTIRELIAERDAAVQGWREETRLRQEDATRHAAELEALTAPKSSVDRVIEKTESKKAR